MSLDFRLIRHVQDLVTAGDTVAIQRVLPEDTFAATPRLEWDPCPEELEDAVLRDAYTYWSDLCPSGSIPKAGALSLKKSDSITADTTLLGAVDDGWDFAYLHYGPGISETTGIAAKDRFVSTMPIKPGQRIFFAASYRAVLCERKPLLSWHVTPLDMTSSSWDRLIMPLAPPNGSANGAQVMVCMKARGWGHRPETSQSVIGAESAASGVPHISEDF